MQIPRSLASFGTGAVIVMDDSTCMVRVLQRIARFYMSESCGQCTPCREGTGWFYRMLTRIVGGRGRDQDIDRWLIGLDMTGAQVDVYELPTIQGMFPRMFSTQIDNGMRSKPESGVEVSKP